ncbi:hypothetical protein HRbin06_00770 [archaeon HR06]|nr:hypothetical protein HRbin06_00770 [archaeon HR06]
MISLVVVRRKIIEYEKCEHEILLKRKAPTGEWYKCVICDRVFTDKQIYNLEVEGIMP